MAGKQNLTNASSRMAGEQIVTNASSPGYIDFDGYSMGIKLSVVTLTSVCIIYSVMALISLQRTRRTPETARFLSSALISYDIMAVICFNIRRFVENNDWNIMIQVVGISLCNLALITIGMMSVERLLIFYSPYFYLRYVTFSLVKKVSLVLWVVSFMSYWFVRVVLCAIGYPPFSYFNIVSECNYISVYYYGFAIVFVTTTSIVCFVQICLILRKEHAQINPNGNCCPSLPKMRFLRNYRSTTLVFLFCMTSTASAILYAIIISLRLGPIDRRLWIDAVNTFNCMMDPLLYVVWYKECRMEILKLLSVCFPSLSPRVESMRRNLFSITSDHDQSL